MVIVDLGRLDFATKQLNFKFSIKKSLEESHNNIVLESKPQWFKMA